MPPSLWAGVGDRQQEVVSLLKKSSVLPKFCFGARMETFLLYIAKDKQAFRVGNTKAWSGDVYLGVGTDGVSLASGEYFRI